MDATRYLTVVATVATPDDNVWDQIVARRVHALLEELGLQLVPCGWAPDVDTIAVDGLDADPARLTVLDMNPPLVKGVRALACEGCEGSSGQPIITDKGYCRACYDACVQRHPSQVAEFVGEILDPIAESEERWERSIAIEATCGLCGEIYNPEFPTDEHFQQANGRECNGRPESVRWWR